MTLYKLDEFYPNYREELFDGDDIKGLDVYAGRTKEKIGTIDNVLVDEEGRFRYFVVDTGFWIFGKKVLLPVGYCQVDTHREKIYATGIVDKKQVEDLPEYDESKINRKYEERIRGVYRNSENSTINNVVPIEASAPLEAPAVLTNSNNAVHNNYVNNETDSYNYREEPAVYDLNQSDHQTLKLYEERLVANKKRRSMGEVVVAKHVETEKAQVSLPVEKERVIIERTTPTHSERIATQSEIAFREGEIARMKVYEETADIHKEAFVREEVRIRKEIEQNIVKAEETLRHEELDIDSSDRTSY